MNYNKIIFILGFVLLSLSSTAQHNEIKAAIFGGPEYSILQAPNDSIAVKGLIVPFFGIETLIPIKNASHLRVGSSLFRKRSIDAQQVKYNNTFVSLFANFYVPISKSIFVSVGPQYSILLNSYSLNGAVEEDITGYNSYMSANVGVDFKLQSHLNLGLVSEFPINNPKINAWPNIKIKLSVIIDKDLFKVKRKTSNQKAAKVKIGELKRSALLVRLRSYKKQLDLLEGEQYANRKQLIIDKRDKDNKEIMTSFKEEFDFCPVYFFYNYDTKKVLNKQFDGIFLNSNLEKDANISFDLDTFMIGELGYMITDTTNTDSYVDVYKNGYNNAEGYSKSSTVESNLAHYGFSIRNQDLKFIAKPFPGYISGYVLFIKRSKRTIINKLNKNLYEHRAYLNGLPMGLIPTRN